MWAHLDHRGVDWGESKRTTMWTAKSLFHDFWISIFKTGGASLTEITHVSHVEYCCCLIPVIYSLLQCSVSCGQGYRQRLISCSEVHVENDNYEYGHQSLSNCPGTPPESYMPCNLGPCPPPVEWRVGIWGLVSEFMILDKCCPVIYQ